MRKLSILCVFVILAVSFCEVPLHAADKLGKIFIKAALSETNGQQFPDAALEDSVKDLKKRLEKGAGPFTLVAVESEADYLLVVVERKVEYSALTQGKTVNATLSVKVGTEWKPGVKLTGAGDWSNAARVVMGKAEAWVKANRGKQ